MSNQLIEKSLEKLKKFLGRAKWSLLLRKERKMREEAYKNLANGYAVVFLRIWERLALPSAETPQFVYYENLAAMFLVEEKTFSHFGVRGSQGWDPAFRYEQGC